MNSKNIIIVIPIYKQEPTIIDKFSIQKLFDVVDLKYDIAYVRPKSINITNYPQNEKVRQYAFDEKYFTSTTSYSELCKSYEFYNTFRDYKYMLIYQTDCLLLKDDLEYWCSQGYDYIGAPILGSGSGWLHIPYVGNGGLSLRKISTFLYLTNPNGEFLQTFADDIKEDNDKRENGYTEFEDLYFAELVPLLWTGFSKPNYKVAAEFAWDRTPQLAAGINNKLPMGLHAWQKFIGFYKDIIDIPERIVQQYTKPAC